MPKCVDCGKFMAYYEEYYEYPTMTICAHCLIERFFHDNKIIRQENQVLRGITTKLTNMVRILTEGDDAARELAKFNNVLDQILSEIGEDEE